MSDPVTAALAKIAALEDQVARLTKAPQAPAAPQFNQDAFRQALINDPVGVMSKMGVPVEHITKVFVAHALGDQAPAELKVLAAMGPQVSHAQALDSKLETLSRQFSQLTEAQKKNGTRESFKALTADKTKYPNLAKALSADPTLYDSDLDAHGGSAEELAASIESRLSRVAKVFAPPAASEESADATSVQSSKDKPATLSGNNAVPPLPDAKPGVFTEEDHRKLRDEIVRKYSPKDPE